MISALPNIGGALCSTPQSLADAHYKTSWLNKQNLFNRILQQVSDGASTTKDVKEFHKLTAL